ncbi:LysR family transcriptional regulator [Pseudonocardia sp. GCM10023141]|uniref:LysR family transcriptional regulator n=1 Tax=Pseudonocardia sp. GCM10023141 TaxID=3252653 RepID=UPI00360801E4
MEFRYLESFLAIAEELHFGRAAAKLHMAQPSLSQQLRRLEREVGVELVSRSPQQVRLTPAGAAFRVEAQRLMGGAARAVEVAQAAARGLAGELHIGFNYPAGLAVLPRTIALLRAEHPKVAVQLSEMRSGPQLDGLLADELDVGFGYGAPRPAQLASRELLSVPVVALVGAQHPWARRESISMLELGERPCVLFRREQSPAMYDAIVEAVARAGTQLKVVAEVDDPIAAGIVISARPLLCFASAARASRASAQGLVSVPLTGPVPQLAVHAVWRAAATSDVVAAFLDSLAAAAPFTWRDAERLDPAS